MAERNWIILCRSEDGTAYYGGQGWASSERKDALMCTKEDATQIIDLLIAKRKAGLGWDEVYFRLQQVS